MSAVTRGGPFVPVPGLPPRSPAPQAPNRYTRTRTRPVNPGGPFVPRPDLGPGVGFGPGLPRIRRPAPIQQPSPITAAQQVLSQPGIQNAIGTMPGIAGGMVNQLQQSQDPNTQAIGNLLSGIGGMVQPTIGGMVNAVGNQLGVGNAGGKSAPAQPGGPYTPRPDLGPNVGFGVGLPQSMPNPEQSTFTEQINQGVSPIANAVGQPGYPMSVGGKSMPGGPSMGFGAQAPIGQETNPQYQYYANYQGPGSAGFNPSLGNTTLPGNF